MSRSGLKAFRFLLKQEDGPCLRLVFYAPSLGVAKKYAADWAGRYGVIVEPLDPEIVA